MVEKFEEFQAGTGGFGTVMAYGHDYIDNAAAWNESLRLLAQEVAPRVAGGPSGDGTIARAAAAVA